MMMEDGNNAVQLLLVVNENICASLPSRQTCNVDTAVCVFPPVLPLLYEKKNKNEMMLYVASAAVISPEHCLDP